MDNIDYVFESSDEFCKELYSGCSGAYLPNPIQNFVLSGRSSRLASLLAHTFGGLREAGVTSDEILEAIKQVILDCGWEHELVDLMGVTRRFAVAEPPQNPDPSPQDESSNIQPIETEHLKRMIEDQGIQKALDQFLVATRVVLEAALKNCAEEDAEETRRSIMGEFCLFERTITEDLSCCVALLDLSRRPGYSIYDDEEAA